MQEAKKPLDLRDAKIFYCTALAPNLDREYRILDENRSCVVICETELQLRAAHGALSLPKTDTDSAVIDLCDKLIGCVMSNRIHDEDYFDSGRCYSEYQIAWIPETEYQKIIRSLEKNGEHAL